MVAGLPISPAIVGALAVLPGGGGGALSSAVAVEVVIGLVGGIGLFILGMERLSHALQRLVGERLRDWLGTLAPNPYLGAVVGATLTALVQSSSVTTIMVVGLVQAEVIGLTRAVGVIFGANVGTTVTTQIIAFHIAHYGLLCIGLGVPILFLARRDGVRQAGAAMVGFGLLLFGMEVMGQAVVPLRGDPLLARWLASLSNPVAGIAAGVGVTVVLQSSAAVTGILIALAVQGIVPLEAAIAIVLGANVGTCLKINLAAVGKSREAVRAATANLLFNVIGVALWVGFLPLFAALLRQLTPAVGVAATPHQVANAHTLFNLVNALLLLPLAPLFARGLRLLVPDRDEEARFESRYLDQEFLESPAQALEAVRQEARRMGWVVDTMFDGLSETLFRADLEAMREIAAKDDLVDYLERQIADYLRLISSADLAPHEAQEVMSANGVVNEIEHIGDVIELDLGHLVQRLARAGAGFTPEGRTEIAILLETVRGLVARAIDSFVRRDPAAAADVVGEKGQVRAMEEQSRHDHVARLQGGIAESLATHAYHLDALNCVMRIDHHARRIARMVITSATAPARRTKGRRGRGAARRKPPQ
ncbi:MAG: hypothetical protein COW73_00515 [Nitrospirae bacterium CG18_big_fil_WC_8_21_14_2_50_70_55]|nr:Na/Pi cotransporter family protein [Deltaproteobacteria bacterium]OIP66348.1 MAG: hypothetical protein AUK30_02600 [Nitrospirae bacterium CG2_30_70_394]PIQ07208.1 MAG: hypothetical protein COW73_00515 [Nitrospirae bacterium CG18_big_fil_WC_8_21_14_2_50_70_55]PIU78481.1 MAG: hypothetical protein COS73_06990 [Nitrospirae bacterium CG06_land_8_20_14_3_00_70_43]PIW83200.1 MAG: hypothetical protein COZ96_04575 [Nitrospirae bacterium CG_4_8_14_3_um_filter_70_85]PIX84400.1 MAG: hypothetical protei